MKTPFITTAILLLTYTGSIACTVCGKQQPKILQGITHGAGPQSDLDYIVIAAVAFIVLISLLYSVKYILRPGERNKEHIKYIILNTPEQ